MISLSTTTTVNQLGKDYDEDEEMNTTANTKQKSTKKSITYQPLNSAVLEEVKDLIEDIRDMLEDGRIVPFIDGEFGLENVDKAVGRLEERKVMGKVLLEIE